MTYYNTNSLDEKQLGKAISKTNQQQLIIKDIFLNLPKKGYTPYQILDKWPRGKKKPLITSVRRAINNLTYMGLLKKLDETVIEREGAPNHLWKMVHIGSIDQTSQGQVLINI